MKKDILKRIKKATPTILTVLGSFGVVATAVLAVKSHEKFISTVGIPLNEISKKGEPTEETKKWCVIETAKCFVPAVGAGAATIACIVGANVLNKHQQASLMSGYMAANEAFRQYRKGATAVYGPDADSKIKAAVARQVPVFDSATGDAVYDPSWDEDSEKQLFYDNLSQQYFRSTLPAVLNAQYHINRNLVLKGVVTLDEFCDFLGIPRVKDSDQTIWDIECLMEMGLEWLDFCNQKVTMDDGMVCYVVYSTLPTSDDFPPFDI